MANILVVDDNHNLRRLMGIHLSRAGYTVYEAENGQQALDQLERVPIHLMIVDILMPLMDGFELTVELRNANANIPVLMVTAKEALSDKRRGFEVGADDYMVKPVDFDEMLLRVNALLRRSRIANEHKLVFGDVELNSDDLTVKSINSTIELPKKEFQLLFMLLSYPNKILTRQDIMDEIWGYETQTDVRTVDVHIRHLREKFADVPDFEIVTVRGLGYKVAKPS